MDITIITKLYSIFSSKNWHGNDGNEIVFTNFCQLLTNLTEPQRELLLDLAERYTWLTFSEYQGKLTSVLNSVEDEKIESLNRIILFPVMRPEDEAKTKSGHNILFFLRGIRPFLLKYKHIKFDEVESFDFFSDVSFTLKQDECIYLLDDYLGTGDTIKSTIDLIISSTRISANQINVISIASQKQAVEVLRRMNIKLYTDLVTIKGITDFYNSPQLEEKILLMKEIETLIPKNKFNFGYKQSEALITLYRTPNNTFPIFWKEHKKNDELFEAPFPRF